MTLGKNCKKIWDDSFNNSLGFQAKESSFFSTHNVGKFRMTFWKSPSRSIQRIPGRMRSRIQEAFFWVFLLSFFLGKISSVMPRIFDLDLDLIWILYLDNSRKNLMISLSHPATTNRVFTFIRVCRKKHVRKWSIRAPSTVTGRTLSTWWSLQVYQYNLHFIEAT